MHPDRLSDEALLHGDDARGELFAAFYRRHARWVLRALARQGVDPATAADVLAETFMTALTHRADFDPGRGSAAAWLTGILRHKLAEDWRRSARTRRLAERLGMQLPTLSDTDAGGFEALRRQLDQEVDDQRLSDAIGALPHAQQRAVLARVVDEEPYRDVARALNTSEVGARKHVSRGLSALRRRLAG
ncbi:MAG TPA: sigma-70 family RNA polymerase sigma factor [Solirubrobacteraceae bacterium]|nr:sigma-70 family RNA polymerase sigma factor [Solirubrobacteraceae bacterium]